jgi:methylglutaconyl-CoA hydratase
MEQMVTTQKDVRGVATVTLNNPDKHNAFDNNLIAQISATFGALEEDSSVRVVILQGAGRSFSAGADLAWMRRMADFSRDENIGDANLMAEMFRRINSLSKPTIAKVHGAAFGGGVGLVACCDLVFATPAASFCLSEVRIGLIPAVISPFVIAAIGARAARRYAMTAERFDAATAVQLGLVSELCEEAELDQRIEGLVETLLANGPRAMAAAKQLIADVAGAPITDQLMADTSQRIAVIRGSEEGREGVTAFLQKRAASWIGE